MPARRLLRALLALVLLIMGVAVLGVAVLVATNPQPRDSVGWSLAAPLPEGRGEVAVAVAGGQLWVIGGMAGAPPRTAREVSVYDPATDAWSAAPDLPEPRHHTAAAGMGEAVYVSGGGTSLTDWTPSASLWRLPLEGATWEALTAMPEPRLGHRMMALDDQLYVVGGQGGSGALMAYDPADNSWTVGAPMPLVRDHLAAVVVEGEIWVIGGRNGGLSGRVDIYDPAADQWREGPPLPEVTSGAAEAAAQHVVLISGGEDPSPTGAGVFDRHWWLDTSDATAGWRELRAPPLPVHGAQGAVVEGRFYIAGGATRAGGMSALAWSNALQMLDLSEAGVD
jgi:hypothetical protein